LTTLRYVRIPIWILLAAIGLALFGCNRRVEPYIPLEEEPPRLEGPVRIPGLGNPSAQGRVLASTPQRGMAPAAPSAPGGMAPAPARAPGGKAPAASRGAPIQGTVRLGPGVSAPPTAAVFVTARPAGGGGLLAAIQLPASDLPRAFEIGPTDVRVQNRPFQGPIVLQAHVDVDGDPSTRSPDDLVASLASPVEPGAADVELVLAPVDR
jgi:hypothetical protein